jgi:hypothetical protein
MEGDKSLLCSGSNVDLQI